MNSKIIVRVGALALLIGCGDAEVPIEPAPLPSQPPFGGTIFIDPDIITPF